MRSVQLHIFSHFGGLITEVSLQFFPPATNDVKSGCHGDVAKCEINDSSFLYCYFLSFLQPWPPLLKLSAIANEKKMVQAEPHLA